MATESGALHIYEAADTSSAIADGAHTAFINKGHPSSALFRPRFISNDHLRGRKISATIERELSRCDSFDFSVAFITESGITPLLQTLRELEQAGIPGRILTTDYLAFSEPRALERLARLSNVEVRMYVTESTSKSFGFHTKGYLFHYGDGTSKAIIGSANLTGSALAVNHEWNLQFVSTEHGELIQEINSEFDHLWNCSLSLDSRLDEYRRLYEDKKRTLAQQKIITYEQASLEPNSMQASFMASLRKSVEEGKKRALLISATGTGKTYASAFAVRSYQPRRLLFLAHREQVLKQSLESYRRVLGKGTYGLLSGNAKDRDASFLFATMQTMRKDDTLASFSAAEFDIIVIDEVHRAGSASYQKIINHFEPRFFLGMTASPDRPDGFDIYRLFDNNIVHEIRLKQALEENLLCPFHYFGITDLSIDGAPLDETTDFSHLVAQERVRHIVEQMRYYGFSGTRVKGLMFCRTNEEARELSSRFNECGLRTLALSGENTQEERENAIDRLVANENDPSFARRLDYILSVDIFNEGVDIPDVNQVVMLRPTQSPIIFVQQLGRGLRKAPGKEYVVVLDFIGNYANNYMIPLALSGDRTYSKDCVRKFVMEGDRTIPGASSVHFDEISRQRVFESIDNATVTMKLLKDSYSNLKHKLGRIPCMVDFLDHGEIDPLLFIGKKRSYYRFLAGHEKCFASVMNEDEHLVIEFISRYMANGMRPHELLALQRILQGQTVDRESLASELYDYYLISLDDESYESTIGMLSKKFMNVESDCRSYSNVSIVQFDGDEIIGEIGFLELLKNPVFKDALQDLTSFGIRRFEERYLPLDGPFKLYEKYTRKDACRLLNWNRDSSSTVYGYRIKHNTCPIFVTYNKQDSIASSTQYDDRFVDRDYFAWMTRSRLTLESSEVQQIANSKKSGLELHLFIKKNDSEGGDFYYMGQVAPTSWTQEAISDDNGKELPVVRFIFRLAHSVQDDMYEYFESRATMQKEAS